MSVISWQRSLQNLPKGPSLGTRHLQAGCAHLEAINSSPVMIYRERAALALDRGQFFMGGRGPCSREYQQRCQAPNLMFLHQAMRGRSSVPAGATYIWVVGYPRSIADALFFSPWMPVLLDQEIRYGWAGIDSGGLRFAVGVCHFRLRRRLEHIPLRPLRAARVL
jgi:hypothetical protein